MADNDVISKWRRTCSVGQSVALPDAHLWLGLSRVNNKLASYRYKDPTLQQNTLSRAIPVLIDGSNFNLRGRDSIASYSAAPYLQYPNIAPRHVALT